MFLSMFNSHINCIQIALKLHRNWFKKRTCHTTREYPIPTIQSTPRYPLESVQLLPVICMIGPNTSRDKRWKGFSIFFAALISSYFIFISYSSHIHLIHPPPPPPPPPPPSHHRTCSCKFQLIESQSTFDFAQDNHVCQRVASWIASITCTRPDSTTQTLFSRRFESSSSLSSLHESFVQDISLWRLICWNTSNSS